MLGEPVPAAAIAGSVGLNDLDDKGQEGIHGLGVIVMLRYRPDELVELALSQDQGFVIGPINLSPRPGLLLTFFVGNEAIEVGVCAGEFTSPDERIHHVEVHTRVASIQREIFGAQLYGSMTVLLPSSVIEIAVSVRYLCVDPEGVRVTLKHLGNATQKKVERFLSGLREVHN